jgi:hypothetical protein
MKTTFTDLFEFYKELFERLLKAEKERTDELNWYLETNHDDSHEMVIVNVAFLSGSVLYDKHFVLKDIAPETQEELVKELEKIEQALTSPAIVLTNDDAKVLHRTIKEYINLGMTPDYRLIELRDLFNAGKIQAAKGFRFNIVVYEQIKSLFENYLDEYFKNLKADKVYEHRWSNRDCLSMEDFEKIALIIKVNPELSFVGAVEKFVKIENPSIDLEDIKLFIDDFKNKSSEGQKLLEANPWFTDEHFRKIFHDNIDYRLEVESLIF